MKNILNIRNHDSRYILKFGIDSSHGLSISVSVLLLCLLDVGFTKFQKMKRPCDTVNPSPILIQEFCGDIVEKSKGHFSWEILIT